VNNAIKNAAKDLHNQQYSRDFGLLDTYMVFGRSL
jgi:hypothetical protein